MLGWLLSKRHETTRVAEGVEKREPWYSVGRNVNWCSHYGRFLKKLKIEPAYDPGISLLGIYPKETNSVSRRDICTSTFIAALFTTAKMETN